MKKFIKLIYILFIMIILFNFNKVNGAEYKTDSQGNYYVQEARCVYQINEKNYQNDKYTLVVKDGAISHVQAYSGITKKSSNYYEDELLIDGLTYGNLFKNKEFKLSPSKQ